LTQNAKRVVIELKKLQLQRIKTKNKTVFIPGKANKQNFLQYFAHRIHSSPLWSSEKRPVQNTQSASFSSSVESSARGTASSVSESDGVSDVVGSHQTFLFLLFEGTRRAFDASRQVLNLVARLIFSF
jgi:hypothetical protein